MRWVKGLKGLLVRLHGYWNGYGFQGIAAPKRKMVMKDKRQPPPDLKQKLQCDAICKQILSWKAILARIMKACLEEYKDCDVEEIASKFIEGTPEVSKEPVFPEDVSATILGTDTTDKSLPEGDVAFDVCFQARTPHSKKQIGLIINVEAQNNFYPGYPLIKRGLYYCARLFSSQRGKNFTGSNYNKLEKVYSIWVCLNPPKDRENTITRYSIDEHHLIGGVCEEIKNYDMLSVIMICLGDLNETSHDGILRLLDTAFSDISPEEKIRIMQDDFNIPMAPAMEGEINNMGSFSDAFFERGIEQGLDKARTENIETLMKKMNFSANEAMDFLEIPKAEQQKYLDILAAQCA